MTTKPSRKTFRQRLDTMVNRLREDILAGKLEVGQFLPAESELARMFQLSNLSVRKGLDALVQERLIAKIPSVGNQVIRPADGPVVIRFGYHSTIEGEAEMVRLIDEFHRLHPGIKVETLEIPNFNYSKIAKQYMEAGLLDLITLNNVNFQEMLEMDGDKLLQSANSAEDTYPFLSEAFRREGKLLARPLVFSPLVLCYNCEHFREQGIPVPAADWTWPDLFEAAGKLAVDNERFGFYFHLLSRNRWSAFLLQSGMGFTPDEDGEYRLCGTPLMQSLQMGRQLVQMPDVFPVMLSASDADAERLFLEQKVSVIMTTYFALNDLRKAQFAYDLAPLPSFRERRTLLLVIGLAVNAKSEAKEAAGLLADYLTSQDAQLLLRKHSLSIPAARGAAEWQGQEAIARPSWFHLYRELEPTFRLIGDLGLSSAGLGEVQRQIKLYWSGLQDEDELCRSLSASLTALNRHSSVR